MWPFSEKRQIDATEAHISHLENLASGSVVDATSLAITEACVSLIERAVASATVGPHGVAALAGIDAPLLALVGRALATSGNFVGAIRVDAGAVRIVPASSFDIAGDADPMTWRYRCDFVGPTGSVSETLAGDAIIHVRHGADRSAPWRGIAPLKRAAATAKLAGLIENSLSKELNKPVGLVATVPDSTGPQRRQWAEKILAGGLVVRSISGVLSGGAATENSSRIAPAPYGPEPQETVRSIRADLGYDVAGAFGISPALFAARGDGGGQRESWRRFWAGTVAPIGLLIEAELRAKLDRSASLSFESMRAADEDGRSRAVSRRAAAAKTLAELEDVTVAEALQLAGIRR